MAETTLINNIPAAVRLVRAAANDLSNRAARKTVEVAQALAPVSAGEHPDGSPHLRDTIEQVQEATDTQPAVVEVGAEYGEQVEFGGHLANGGSTAAQPYFIPAVEQAKEEYRDVNLEADGYLSD